MVRIREIMMGFREMKFWSSRTYLKVAKEWINLRNIQSIY
jgi:hypothetical protein